MAMDTITDWSQPGLADQLGLDESKLMVIINASNEATNDMLKLNNRVHATEESFIAAMQADPGRIIRDRLATWTDDYFRIVSNFVELNRRCEAMLRTLQHANADATANASKGA